MSKFLDGKGGSELMGTACLAINGYSGDRGVVCKYEGHLSATVEVGIDSWYRQCKAWNIVIVV